MVVRLKISLEKAPNLLAKVLCYPRPTSICFKERIRELKRIGVTDIFLGGPSKITNELKVLGKGTVGIVVKGVWRNKLVAIKVRRVDANREELSREAFILSLVNRLGIGPRLYTYSKDFLIMEYVKGVPIYQYLNECDVREARKIILEILRQCRELDRAGIDHGELSRADKHIYITKEGKVYLIDFETASTLRKPSNVTSICSYLFFKRTKMSERIRKVLDIDIEKLRWALREYKSGYDDIVFFKILKLIIKERVKNIGKDSIDDLAGPSSSLGQDTPGAA